MPLLDWVNRNQAEETADQVPYHLLELKESYGDSKRVKNNLIIHGDNLVALKALLPLYSGQVKCIFIDPPYNTEQAFENYDDKLENAQWLSMMFPRLQILKKLLNYSGSIFVQLDDNQLDYFKVICDEVFGKKNFINRITIDARSPSAFSTVNKGVFKATEYLLWYAKDKSQLDIPKLRVPREPDYAYDKWIDNIDDSPEEWKMESLSDVFNREVKLRTNKPNRIIEKYNKFITENAAHIIRLASISDSKAGKDIVELKRKSQDNVGIVYRLERKDYDDVYILDGQQILFYEKNIETIDGQHVASKLLTNIWYDIAWEGIAKEGGVVFRKGKKPEALIKRCLELTTSDDDIVLDSFLGSGTTSAVAHKMGRRYIGIEMGEQARTHALPRLKAVINGEQTGISKAVRWEGGGGFSFYNLGSPVFNEQGFLHSDVKFNDLASYVWWLETKTPLQSNKHDTPFLGVYNEVAYYLLYNDVLGDKRPRGGNLLTHKVLKYLDEHYAYDGKRIIIGEATRIGDSSLEALNIEFKQIPYALYGTQANKD